MKFLVALDDTPRARHVLEVATELAGCLDAGLVPFRAVQVPPEFPPAAATRHRDELPEFLIGEARQGLKRLTAVVSFARLVEPLVRIGQPWRAIVDAAEEVNADLIVLGSHGYHGLDRVLGTNARLVTDAAHHDVYVVHDGPSAPCHAKSALIALGGSPRDSLVLSKGVAFAHALHASIHLVRVIQVSHSVWPPDRAILADLDLERAGPATDEVRSAAKADATVVSRRVVLSATRAWRAILEAAREAQADLVIVGSHRHRSGDSIIRTTPGHMVDQARENVLVIHQGRPGAV